MYFKVVSMVNVQITDLPLDFLVKQKVSGTPSRRTMGMLLQAVRFFLNSAPQGMFAA